MQMPVSSGIRLRPNLGLRRSISAQRLRIGKLTQILPLSIIMPLAGLAFVTAAIAVFWTSSIHNADAIASIEAPVTTGSVSKAN
jgi:hypothetical protein